MEIRHRHGDMKMGRGKDVDQHLERGDWIVSNFFSLSNNLFDFIRHGMFQFVFPFALSYLSGFSLLTFPSFSFSTLSYDM